MARSTLTSVALALLLGSQAAFASPLSNIPDAPLKVHRDLLSKRDPPKALGEAASDKEVPAGPGLRQGRLLQHAGHWV